jgi:hypothetical protein
MGRKRVPWDGPNPEPGEFLRKRSGDVCLIRAVEPMRKPDSSGARLVLDLASVPIRTLPKDATVHSWMRAVVTISDGPARVRQIHIGGAAAVMKAVWRDPEDNRTYVRRAREISGWRTFCPLRRMAASRGSQITDEHIVAADLVRECADLALIGFSSRAGAVPIFVDAGGFGPRSGPAEAAIAQVYAMPALRRVVSRLTAGQQRMLAHFVLANRTMSEWCSVVAGNAQVEMGRLLGMLDVLADLHNGEVETALAADDLVRAA